MSTEWYGWARLRGRWRRLTASCPTMTAAAKALDAELCRRGLRPKSRDTCLTPGFVPRDGAHQETTQESR